LDPVTPLLQETSRSQNGEQTAPTDAAKSFREIQFQDNGGLFPFVAALNQFGGIDKIL
jgi:hypothetical protein